VTAALRAIGHALVRRRGTPQWDAVVRGSGLVALLSIYPAMRWPGVAGLVGFLGVTIVVNGPLSPLFPATFEPLLILAGRLYPPLVVAVVATVGTLYIEFINYHVYGWVVMHPRLEGARRSFWVRKSVALFERSPFVAVWLLAFTPLPYWVARILGPMTRYPVGRYLFATFLGRFPRLWFYAALGVWLPVSTPVLVGLTVTSLSAVLLVVGWRQWRSAVRQPRAIGP
jgi:membrane protein YqaA with SNARE-associated domain